jgi:Uma2 family endonuclease
MATTQATQADPTATHPAPTGRPRRRFTADEYHRMADAGILREDERVELLGGDVVEMTPVGDRHVEGVNRCVRAFSPAWIAGRLIVSAQNPIRLGDHDEPQPDVALAPPGTLGAPRLGQVLLAIEVADSSVEDDRAVKLPLYARAGVPEAWLLNVRDGTLEVSREPRPAGYARTATYHPNQRVAPAAFPDVVLRVAELLPPPGMPRFTADPQDDRPG